MVESDSKTFISALRPFIFFTNVMGLMPIRLKNEPRRSNILKFYNIIIIILISLLFGYAIYNRYRVSESQKFYYFNDFFLIIFGYFLLLSAIGLPIIQTDLAINAILKFKEIDVLLNNIRGKTDHRKSFKYYVVNMCFCLLMSITVVSCDSTSNEHKGSKLIPFNVFLYIIYIYAFMNLLEFNCFVFILTQRIQVINSVLKSHIGRIEGSKSIIPSGVWNLDESRKAESATCEIIHVIQDIHFKLIEINRLINSIFSAQILITSILTLVELTVNLYYLIVRSLDVEKKQGGSAYDIQRPVIWFIFNVLLTFSFVLPCVWAMSKGNHTPELIHKLILKTNNTSLQTKLSIFSLQLLHHNITFTAAGFFTLNMSLIVSITAAVTSYLVILVQFAIAN